jgi:hypothetical protein
MGAQFFRTAKLAAPLGLATIVAWATPAFAQAGEINAADTAWIDPGQVRGVTFALLKLVSAFVPLRVTLQQELEGLDISQAR